MTMSGMNIPEVRRIAAGLRRCADSMVRCSEEVDRLMRITQASWSGEDVAAFQRRWNGKARGEAHVLASDLKELAATAQRNAEAQQRTSDELDSGAAGSPSTGKPGGPVITAPPSTPVPASPVEPGRETGVTSVGDDPAKVEGVKGKEYEKKFGEQPAEKPPVNIRYDISKGEAVLLGGEVSGKGHVGNDLLGAQYSASATAGIKGDYEVYAGSAGLAVGASIMAGVQASASGSAYAGPLAVAGKVDAMAGAKAEGTASIGPDGLGLKGEAFAGAKATASGTADIGGVGVSGKAEGWAGVGVEAHLDVGVTDGKLVIGGSFGAALGIGGSVGGSVTIDLNKTVDTLKGAASAVSDFFGSLW